MLVLVLGAPLRLVVASPSSLLPSQSLLLPLLLLLLGLSGVASTVLEGPSSSAVLEAEAGLGYGVSPVVLSAAGLLCTCVGGGAGMMVGCAAKVSMSGLGVQFMPLLAPPAIREERAGGSFGGGRGRGLGLGPGCESLSLLDSPDIGVGPWHRNATSSISSLERSAAELYSSVGEGSKERVLAMESSKLARAPVSWTIPGCHCHTGC